MELSHSNNSVSSISARLPGTPRGEKPLTPRVSQELSPRISFTSLDKNGTVVTTTLNPLPQVPRLKPQEDKTKATCCELFRKYVCCCTQR